jgi:hypothetical protein
VNFSERPPSKQWAALKYRGKQFAEVWFKPEGEPFAMTFRIPQESFQTPGLAPLLTMENLLLAVAIATDEVASWHHGDVSHSDSNESITEFNQPLPPLPQDIDHLMIHVSLKPPQQVGAADQTAVPEDILAKWQDLQARWKSILVLEASIDALRQSVESLRTELDTTSRKSLTAEEKVNALSSDVAQLNKAKSRVHHGVPKARDFVHRATWAMATPERKNLDEFFKNHTGSDIPVDQLDPVSDQMDNLLKERQILSAQGVTVSQECKGIAAEIRTALTTLQNNAAARAHQKRIAKRGKS